MLAVSSSALVARADGVQPASASPVQREQAQAKFLRGKDLFAHKKFEEALGEFRASIEIVASPNTRLEISRTLRAMARFVAAYSELGRTLVEAKELSAQDSRYQRAYEAAMQERADLQPLLGFVSLTVTNPSEGTRVVVGGEDIRRAAWSEPVPVFGGKTEIDVETPGHAAIQDPVSVAAGATISLTVDAQSGAPDPPEQVATPAPVAPSPPPQSPSTLRPWAWIAGGVGVAGLATFVISGAIAKSTYDDLQSSCGGGVCPGSKAGEIASGRAQQVVANVGLGVGLVGLAAGGVLYFLSIPRAPATSAVFVSPGAVGFRATF
jgi:hypothetical protein